MKSLVQLGFLVYSFSSTFNCSFPFLYLFFTSLFGPISSFDLFNSAVTQSLRFSKFKLRPRDSINSLFVGLCYFVDDLFSSFFGSAGLHPTNSSLTSEIYGLLKSEWLAVVALVELFWLFEEQVYSLKQSSISDDELQLSSFIFYTSDFFSECYNYFLLERRGLISRS